MTKRTLYNMHNLRYVIVEKDNKEANLYEYSTTYCENKATDINDMTDGFINHVLCDQDILIKTIRRIK